MQGDVDGRTTTKHNTHRVAALQLQHPFPCSPQSQPEPHSSSLRLVPIDTNERAHATRDAKVLGRAEPGLAARVVLVRRARERVRTGRRRRGGHREARPERRGVVLRRRRVGRAPSRVEAPGSDERCAR